MPVTQEAKKPRMKYDVDEEQKTIKVFDKVGFLIAKTKYEDTKDLNAKKRLFKANRSFNKDIHTSRVDSGLFKEKQPPVYESKIYGDEESVNTLTKKLRENLPKGDRYQYYYTAKFSYLGRSEVAHGRSNTYTRKRDLKKAKQEAYENLVKYIDAKLGVIDAEHGKGDFLRESNFTIGIEKINRLEKNLSIKFFHGIVWYKGANKI